MKDKLWRSTGDTVRMWTTFVVNKSVPSEPSRIKKVFQDDITHIQVFLAWNSNKIHRSIEAVYSWLLRNHRSVWRRKINTCIKLEVNFLVEGHFHTERWLLCSHIFAALSNVRLLLSDKTGESGDFFGVDNSCCVFGWEIWQTHSWYLTNHSSPFMAGNQPDIIV